MKRFSRMLTFGIAVLLVAGPVAGQNTSVEKYSREARAHAEMTAGYIGNPNHPLDANMANHCSQMAKLALANAERARSSNVVEHAVPPPPPLRIGRTPSPSH